MAKKKETEKIEEAVKEELEQLETESVEEVAEELAEEVNPKLQKKRDNREAKAARKEKNKVEEEHKRPSNKVLAILIFGVLILMFLFIWGYNLSQKEASIQSYIKSNGGKDVYSNINMGDGTTLSVTAKKNNMKVLFDITTDDVKGTKKTYKKDSTVEFVKYVTAYYLSTIKPETRAVFAKADCVIKINDKEFNTYTIRYMKADKIVEDYTGESEDE